MRKLFLLFIGLTFIACNSDKKSTSSSFDSSKNQLLVNFDNIDDDTNVIITEYGESDKPVATDTLTITDQEIIFDIPKKEQESINSISVEGLEGIVYFFNDGEAVQLDLYKDEMGGLDYDFDIKGGESNDLFYGYMKEIVDRTSTISKIRDGYTEEELQTDEVQDVLAKEQQKLEDDNLKFRKKLIEDHSSSLASAYILADALNARVATGEQLAKMYESLSDEVKNSSIGKELKHAISPERGFDVGDIVTDFEAPTPEGNKLSLKEVIEKEGKYTLIEFWASWCPNCQEEMPHLVKIYEKYHNKGLNIIGVSIDEEKKEWMKMIEDYGMNWEHVSNLSKWQDPIVKEYAVESIPDNYLVDQDGKVVAKGLKNKDLEKTIAELLN